MSRQNWALARNIVIYSELNKALSALNSSGIKVIVLAGAALAQRVYPDIGLRPMSDIDFLARQADLPIIEPALAQAGYLLETNRNDERHYQNTNPDVTVHIDLHLNLPYFSKDYLDELWRRAIRTELADCATLVLAPEDALIYAAADAVLSHTHINEVCLNDIKFIIKNAGDRFDWNLLIKRIKQLRFEALFYHALILANKKVYAEIPDWVTKEIKPLNKKFLESWIYKRIASNRFIGSDLAPILRFIILPRKGRLLRNTFIPSTDFMRQRYELSDGKLSCLYYPFRVLSNLGRGMKVINRLLWS